MKNITEAPESNEYKSILFFSKSVSHFNKSIRLIWVFTLIYFPAIVAQQLNYYENIEPVIKKHCAECHKAGGNAPFALTEYSEVKAWSKMIDHVTSNRYMPPWKPDPTYQNFLEENVLSEEDIRLISDWIKSGAKEGDASKKIVESPIDSFNVRKPDITISFAKPHKVPGNNLDDYWYFVIPTGLKEDKDLISIDVKPSNPSSVHHALVWEDTLGIAKEIDASTPEYGFSLKKAAGLNLFDNLLPSNAVGTKRIVYTNDMAQKLHAGSNLVVEMHYSPSTVDLYDSTVINLFFAEKPVKRYVKTKINSKNNFMPVEEFIIPANQVKKFHGFYLFDEDVSLINILPHSHKLGKDWEVFAVKPNKDTVKLIRINDWDFNFQRIYSFKKLVVLPKGSVLHAVATYDNTANNQSNPNVPPKTVGHGIYTSDEMFLVFFSWVSYLQGDENISFHLR